jgi:hypothetical protein
MVPAVGNHPTRFLDCLTSGSAVGRLARAGWQQKMAASSQPAKERAMASPNKRLFWTLTATALIALPVTSQARVHIDVEIAPPVAIYEAPPPPRVGFIWAPGYWNWDAPHHKHVWKKGQYIRAHPGERWVSPEWVAHEGRYRFNEGYWERDHR